MWSYPFWHTKTLAGKSARKYVHFFLFGNVKYIYWLAQFCQLCLCPLFLVDCNSTLSAVHSFAYLWHYILKYCLFVCMFQMVLRLWVVMEMVTSANVLMHFFFCWQGKTAEIKCECLDILSDVLHRFGNLITKDHVHMLAALLSQLSSTQASVRKKSVSCIGESWLHLAIILVACKWFSYHFFL